MTQVLYNLRSDGDQWRITKFTDDEVESSYLTSDQACDCPAGHRATCRHRAMLPELFPIRDTQWFYNYDSGAIVDLMGTPKPACAPAEQDTEASVPAGPHVEEDEYLKGIRERWPAGQHTAAESLSLEQTVRATPAWRRL